MQSLEAKPVCPKCGSNEFVQRAGYIYAGKTKEQIIRNFRCSACRRSFRENANKYGTHYSQEVVDKALDLLKKQVPVEDIRRELAKEFAVQVSRPAVLYWARKFLPGDRASVRDTNARVKVVKTILNLISYEELARRAGVKQSTVRAMFASFTMKASFCHSLAAKDYNVIKKRVRILETKMAQGFDELDSIKSSLARREEQQNSIAKMIED